jgi:hypothetical protein
VRFAAVWPRQHRAVVLGALIPAVCLACRIPRMALLDRRLDSPAAFAIWLVSHAGCSLLPPARPPAYWERRRRSVISLCHWLPPIGISSPKRWRKTPIIATAFQAHLNNRRPAPEAGTGTGLGPAGTSAVRSIGAKQTEKRQAPPG